MKAPHLCSAIARQQSSPLLSFLTPSLQTSSRLHRVRPLRRSQYRSIASTSNLSAPENTDSSSQPSADRPIPAHLGLNPKLVSRLNAQPRNTTTAEAAKASKSQKDTGSKSGSERPSSVPETRQYIDPAFREKPSGITFGNPVAFPRPRPARSVKQQQIADLLAETSRPTVARGTRASNSAEAIRDRVPMLNPTARKQEALTFQADKMNPLFLHKQLLASSEHQRIAPQLPVRIDPHMGKAQFVHRENMPLGRALGLLKNTLLNEQINKTLQTQRFHERAGLRRKRLKSERWRTRFADGFRNMIVKVRKMKAQGW